MKIHRAGAGARRSTYLTVASISEGTPASMTAEHSSPETIHRLLNFPATRRTRHEPQRPTSSTRATSETEPGPGDASFFFPQRSRLDGFGDRALCVRTLFAARCGYPASCQVAWIPRSGAFWGRRAGLAEQVCHHRPG